MVLHGRDKYLKGDSRQFVWFECSSHVKAGPRSKTQSSIHAAAAFKVTKLPAMQAKMGRYQTTPLQSFCT